jgi:hypothetical protein
MGRENPTAPRANLPQIRDARNCTILAHLPPTIANGQEQQMMPSRKCGNGATARACVVACVIGLSSLSAGYAQNSDSPPPAGAQGADGDVAARVKQALHSDKAFDDRHVDVAVVHGEVVLTGFVPDSRELLVAGELASKAAGTHKIVNHLAVSQNFPPSP